MSLRRAKTGEFDVVMDLLLGRIEWLRSRGSDQWLTWETWRTKLPPAFQAGHIWLLLDQDEPIGTITIEFEGDPDFWTPEELNQPAVYVSKLAVRLDHAGAGLGELLLCWASDYAYRHGCHHIRLDAWKTNTALHAYYLHRGWTYLRTSTDPRRRSGALFQQEARPMDDRPRDEDGSLTELPTEYASGLTELDPAGNWHPDHVHRGGIKVKYDALTYPQPARFLDFVRYRIRQQGDEWLLESSHGNGYQWDRSGTVQEAMLPLSPGETYIITHQSGDPCRMLMAVQPPGLDQG